MSAVIATLPSPRVPAAHTIGRTKRMHSTLAAHRPVLRCRGGQSYKGKSDNWRSNIAASSMTPPGINGTPLRNSSRAGFEKGESVAARTELGRELREKSSRNDSERGSHFHGSLAGFEGGSREHSSRDDLEQGTPFGIASRRADFEESSPANSPRVRFRIHEGESNPFLWSGTGSAGQGQNSESIQMSGSDYGLEELAGRAASMPFGGAACICG